MFFFGGSKEARVERRGWWRGISSAVLAPRFGGWLGGYAPRWPGARLLDRARRPELAIAIAMDSPLPGLVVVLRAVRAPDTPTGTLWRPELFDRDGASVHEWLRHAWSLRESRPGARAHLQRAGLTSQRLEGGVQIVTLDGVRLWMPEADPLSIELSNAFGDHGSARFEVDGPLASVTAYGSSLVPHSRAGQIRSIDRVDDRGNQPALSIASDDVDRVRKLVLPTGEQILADYDRMGRLAELRSSWGGELRLRYREDATDDLAGFEHGELGAWSLSPQSEDTWLAVSEHAGLWLVRVDGFNHVLREMSPRAEVIHFERDAENGAITSITRPRGRLECFYDLEGFLVYSDDSARGHSELAYDSQGRITKVDVPGLSWVRRVFDAQGRMASVASPESASELRWSDDGKTLIHQRHGGEATLTLSRGRIASATDGGVRWWFQPSDGNTWWLTSSEGQQIYFVVDASGVQRWGTSDGWARTIERLPSGPPTATTDASVSMRVERDRRGDVTAIGSSCSVTRNRAGSVVRVRVGPLTEERDYATGGALTTLQRNESALCLEAVLEHGRALDTTVAGVGRRLVTLDPHGRPVRIEHERSAAIELEHDTLGRARSATRGSVVCSIGRRDGRIEHERVDGAEVRVARDAEGRRLGTSTTRGLGVVLQRDAAGRVVVATVEGTEEIRLAFRYDGAGREVGRDIGSVSIGLERDHLGRVVRRRVSARERAISSTEYRWSGSLLSEQVSTSGWRSSRFEHDAQGTLIGVDGSMLGASPEILFGPRLDEVEYDALGLPTVRGEVRYDHGECGDLRSIIRSFAPERVERDPMGQLARIRAAGRSIEYERDAFGRLVRRVARRYQPAEPGGDEPRSIAREQMLASESTLRMIWDGPRPVHRWTEGGADIAHVWVDGLLVLQIIDGEAYIVVPDQAGDAEALLAIDGELSWSRDPRTLLGGLVDAGAENYGLPTLPDHFFDVETGYWESLFRTLDPATARYLTPNPLGLAAGPRLSALAYDPVRARMRWGIGRGLQFWNELEADTFDLRWTRFVLEQLTCREDERGLAAWRSFDEDLVLDPQSWLLHLAGLE